MNNRALPLTQEKISVPFQHTDNNEKSRYPVPDRAGTNVYLDDTDFQQLLKIYMPAKLLTHLQPHLTRLGELAGAELDELARQADSNPPTLQHRTRDGRDKQSILKHPSYVEMERLAFSEFGLAALSHKSGVLGWETKMPAVAKYAMTFLFVQAEFGLCCPLSMTDSLTRTLVKYGSPQLISRYFEDLTSQDLDTLSQGAMFMTEQGAGSDIAATETLAQNDPKDPQAWLLSGDKWFCSNPDAALAMVLARHEGGPEGMKGVSLFLLPRTLPDGRDNRIEIVRLKDKLGTRSMASGEIRLRGAKAWLVGELGRGFVQMADMVNNSRLSNGMRAAGLMRRAVGEALYISKHRKAFGASLIDMPLMRPQLSKMMLSAEQARTVMFQAAEALRRSDAGEEGAYALTRLLTPLLKFRACRDARKVTGDALEVRGGCGYIEEWSDPRILRDAHLGSVWEGTSNIVALDVIRAIKREGSLPIWNLHLDQLIKESKWHPQALYQLAQARVRVNSLIDSVVNNTEHEEVTRQVASSMYRVTAVVAMAWEATQYESIRRMTLAQLGLIHQLSVQDPLKARVQPDLTCLLEESQSKGRVETVNLFN